jgi:UPF0716 protein FxsA
VAVALVLILLVLWPVIELLVAIEVAGWIGVIDTILLLIVSWPLGGWALRRQGAAAWRRLARAIEEQRSPGREVIDGVLVLIGGVLLIVPGFVTDALGILLLLPFTRALLRPLLIRNLQGRVMVSATRFSRRPYDVDSTAHDVDQTRLSR